RGGAVGYITSRGFKLPDAADEMERSVWFNLWTKILWPYRELQPGEDLYWYESPSTAIVWRTRVTWVEAFPYSNLDDALTSLESRFVAHIDRGQPYLDG